MEFFEIKLDEKFVARPGDPPTTGDLGSYKGCNGSSCANKPRCVENKTLKKNTFR